jgi:signal transduction histidine kinase
MRHSKFVDHFLVPATSRAVLSWPVIASTIFASIAIQIFGSPDLENALFFFRILSATAAVIPMFLLIAIVQIIPFRNKGVRVSAVLLSYIFGGALRGLSVIIFLEGSNILEDGNKWFRVPTSALIMSVEVALATFASANFRLHRETTQKLREESKHLHRTLSQLGRENKATTLRQIQQISTEIVQQLRNIKLSTTESEVDDLQKILNDYIKPLSKSNAPEALQLKLSESEIDSASDKEAWRDLDLIGNLPSVWWNTIAALMPFPTATHFFGLKTAVIHSLFIFVVLVPSTWLLHKALKKYARSLGSPWRELLITLGYFSVALVVALASYTSLYNSSNPNFYAVTTLLIYPLFSWAITIGISLQGQVIEQAIRVKKIRDDLAWAVARVNLIDWFNKGLIARLLHGPIQNSLQAASIRIQESSSENAEKVIEELSQRMNELAPMIESETLMAPDVSKSLGELVELWNDLAKIQVNINQSVQIQLGQDPPAAYITIDICQEICSNAIRHANAREIEIDIVSNDREITISMVDGGDPRMGNPGLGIGTEFLSTCSINWRYIRTSNSKNLLEIVIPTEQEKSLTQSI